MDAYPGEVFEGVVGKVRLNASMTQNVVTYIVEVNTDNSNGRLIPYLTANLKFMVAERKDVLMAPNGSLRWIPQPEQIAPNFRPETPKKGHGKEGEAGAGGAYAQEQKESSKKGTVWLPKGPYVQPLPVSLGVTDGSMTEVIGPGLQEGMQVVVGDQIKPEDGASSASPFTPQLFRGGGSGGPRR